MTARFDTIRRYVGWIARIPREESEEETRDEILAEVKFRGANLWLLVFTMFIACIGLNMDSTYAVIGAMLMSPLMAPVIGLGFSMATNNWSLLKECGWNWLIGFVISLLSSTLFFLVTPFSEPTKALAAFSNATIFDVMLAFFGGLAGFIGITRLRGIKVLAGVAVATACMPPLSTAGYGLANLQWHYFWGGSYFYIINCIYIGMAVMLLAKYMHYAKVVAFHEKPMKARIVYVLAIASLIPASYFAWQLAQTRKETGRVEKFIKEQITPLDVSILKTEMQLETEPKKVEIYLTGHLPSAEAEAALLRKTPDYGIQDVEFIIHKTPELENLQDDPALIRQLTINQEKKLLRQDSTISLLTRRLDSLTAALKK